MSFISPQLTLQKVQYLRDSHNPYLNTRQNSVVLGKKLNGISDKWIQYQQLHSRFNSETNSINCNIERAIKDRYTPVPRLEILSKIDEVKAIEAVREREEQRRSVEKKKRLDNYIAQREIADSWKKQMHEKHRNSYNLNIEKKDYAQQIEEKLNLMRVFERQEQLRQYMSKRDYSNDLNKQVLERRRQKSVVIKLEDQPKNIYEEVQDSRSSAYDSSQRTDRNKSILLRNSSNTPIKPLIQCGNYLVSYKNNI